MRRTLASLLVLSIAATAPAGQALAWGAIGHRMIGEDAVAALPSDMPDWVRGAQAQADVGEWSREPDRLRSAGKLYESDTLGGHFVDIDDDGKVDGGPLLSAMPLNREKYEAALAELHMNSWKEGSLPYSIIESFQRVQADLAYWRLAEAGARTVKDKAHATWLAGEARRRQAVVLTDIGFLSHFVGDGSQPLHVSNHYNGWGTGPNPDGFTTEKIHSAFEGAYVNANVKPADITAAMTPFHDCGCLIEKRVADYLTVTNGQVKPFYQLWKDGGFVAGDARGKAFAVQRLAAGASELRDLVQLAWAGSATLPIGYPTSVPLADVEAGKADPYLALHGTD